MRTVASKGVKIARSSKATTTGARPVATMMRNWAANAPRCAWHGMATAARNARAVG